MSESTAQEADTGIDVSGIDTISAADAFKILCGAAPKTPLGIVKAQQKPTTSTVPKLPETSFMRIDVRGINTLSATEAYNKICGGTLNIAPELTKPQSQETIPPIQLNKRPQTPFMQFPYCPVRIGRYYDTGEGNGNMKIVVTCGFEEITVTDCVMCEAQRKLPINGLGNDLKVFKNSRDVEKLKVELSVAKQEIRLLQESVTRLATIIKQKFPENIEGST